MRAGEDVGTFWRVFVQLQMKDGGSIEKRATLAWVEKLQLQSLVYFEGSIVCCSNIKD